MKHLGFTIQFFLLLISIPLLMYVEMTRDIRQQPKGETETQNEVALNKKAATPDYPLVVFGLMN